MSSGIDAGSIKWQYIFLCSVYAMEVFIDFNRVWCGICIIWSSLFDLLLIHRWYYPSSLLTFNCGKLKSTFSLLELSFTCKWTQSLQRKLKWNNKGSHILPEFIMDILNGFRAFEWHIAHSSTEWNRFVHTFLLN